MMKYILSVLLFLICYTTQAQFPTTDSLRAYNNKYINNSPINSFSSLRMNTLLYGIINHLDSARLGTSGAVGVDTLFAINDSTIRYKKNGVYTNMQLPSYVRIVDDTTLIVNGDTVRVGGTGGGGGSVSLDTSRSANQFEIGTAVIFAADDTKAGALSAADKKKIDSLNFANGEEDKIMLYDPATGKAKYAKAYFKSLKDLLYGTDTIGVKIVRSFHTGYNTGGFQVRFITGLTADYVTSWPSKVFSGSWQRIDYVDILDIEKLGALGQKATQITAATLGYDDDDLTDLYGALFTKATTDYIDVIAWNQAIKALGVSGKRYRWIQGGSNTYYINKDLERFSNYIGSQVYDHFGVIGNNTILQSTSGKHNAFTRVQTNYAGDGSSAVSNKYTIKNIQFREFDTAVAINSSYTSLIDGNIFYRCNFSVVLRWGLGTNVSNNRFEGYDSVALYIGHVGSFADLSTATASAYSYVTNNRFLARTGAKKGIWIDEVNGVYIEQPIFEGGNPEYNVYIRFVNSGGNFDFSTNTREMKIMGGHLENYPTEACIYYEAGASKYLYIEKMYLQTNPVAPFVYAKGENSGSRAIVSMSNMPYLSPGSYPNKMFRSENTEWYFRGIPTLKNAIQDTTYWYGAQVPSILHAEGNAAALVYPYIGSPTTLLGNVTSDVNGYFVGNQTFYGRLKVPEYTDSTLFSALAGNVYYHKDRAKFYGARNTAWSWVLDSLNFLAPTITATANNQNLVATNYTPTFSVGSFTGTNPIVANYASSVAGRSLELRVNNTNSAANSKVLLRLQSSASGTGAGTLNLYNDGLIQQASSSGDLTLQAAGSGRAIYFKPGGASTLGNWTSAGLKIGDAAAPNVSFEISGSDAMLPVKGITSERPVTGVAGYFRFNSDSLALEVYNGTVWRRLAHLQSVRDSSTLLNARLNVIRDSIANHNLRLIALRDSITNLRAGIVPQVNLTAGTNVTITGTYPNLTINSSGGGGTSSETFFEASDANYTITTASGNLAINYYDALTADRTVTLPDPATNTGRRFVIRNGSVSYNINLSASIYENSTTSYNVIAPGQIIVFYSNGTLFKRIQ